MRGRSAGRVTARCVSLLLALGLVLASLQIAPVRAAPAIRLSDGGRTASVELDVLTYNIEGVPWRGGRKGKLREIARTLTAMREAGTAPDIVLFQEAFSREAKAATRASGYPILVTGPARTQRRALPAEGERRGHKWRRGELGLKVVGSGLAIASAYPVSLNGAEPFSGRACAGFDCLSNKGGLFARIDIPGVPGGIDIFNTHMNAQTASGVKPGRHLAAHHAQARELSDFIADRHDPARPVILGGDFNMKGAETRFDFFRAETPLQIVHQVCAQPDGGCDVRLSWDGDAPWMDTQDLQLFASGPRIAVRPLRVESLFDGRPGSPKLSDHDGFRVVYELSWDVR